jgi:hypothetical protein
VGPYLLKCNTTRDQIAQAIHKHKGIWTMFGVIFIISSSNFTSAKYYNLEWVYPWFYSKKIYLLVFSLRSLIKKTRRIHFIIWSFKLQHISRITQSSYCFFPKLQSFLKTLSAWISPSHYSLECLLKRGYSPLNL